MGRFPWLYVALLGFLVVGVVYFVDGIVEYSARVKSDYIKEGESDFLSNVSGQKWAKNKPAPSKWFLLFISLPWLVALIVYVSIHLGLSNLPPLAELILGVGLVVGAWAVSRWVCSYWFDIVYIGYAGVLLGIILLRSLWFKEIVGVGFSNLLAITIAIWSALFTIFVTYLIFKFDPHSGDIGERLLVRWNFAEILIGSAWAIIMGIVMFLGPALKLKTSGVP